MITFGLTGGIACGKSTVTKTFRKHGIPIVDADVVAREVVEPGKDAWFLLREAFGPDYFNQDDTLNREKLGALAFSNPDKMKILNLIMGPAIEKESQYQIDVYRYKEQRIIGYDAALIIENGNHRKYSPLIVVACPQYMQVERLIRRNNLSFDDAVARVKAQMPAERKKQYADIVIDTSGPMERSIAETETIIKMMEWSLKA